MSAPTSIPSGSESAQGNINGVDRLSSLGDELLHHVMSFLPMPEVVRTSLLSPRWRNLWASTPFIHIDDGDFDYGDFEDEIHPSVHGDEKLENFGDNLLLLRDGAVCLDEARIYITREGERRCSVWIRHAIKHKVRLLHVYGSGFEMFPTLDSTAMFPSQHLKIIRLQTLELTRGFFRPLNNDCHVLENLKLEDCHLCDPQEISSISLKVLCIEGGILEGLLICARNLTNLSIIYPDCDGPIVTRGLSSLVTASVIIYSWVLHEGGDIIVDGHRVLHGLSHATTLELHAPLYELAFVRGLQTCPMFSNLTTLVLGDWCTAADFYPLLHILHCSPKLKELSVKLTMEECSICRNSESVLSSLRGTLSSTGSYPSIQMIKISCRKEDPRVGALVQALLPIINPDGNISIKRVANR